MTEKQSEVEAGTPAWVPWAGLGLVMAVQLFLLIRAYMPAPHTGGDNAGYLSLAFSLLDRGAYLDLYIPGEPIHTKYPPGYPLVLATAMVLGARTWAAFKVMSAGFMVLAVAASYRWVWKRSGWQVALGIALVLAFSDSFVYSSLWILSDPMFLALTLIALVAFDQAVQGEELSGRWWAAGVAAALLAYFTRSAGLPLVAAALALLALRRQWRVLGFTALAVGVPAILWWLRSRGAGPGDYASEFWLINPYQPDLGRAGPVELVKRVAENVHLYLGRAIPGGLTGLRGPLVPVLGYGLGVMAVAGWAERVVRTPSVAELFFPLYGGLVLLWPQVWSGDRFALPLFPLVLYYGWAATSGWARRVHPRAAAPLGVVLVLALVVPAGRAWAGYARQGQACRAQAARFGAFGCYQQPVRDFASAAAWSGQHLPEDAVVVVRKPRIYYLLSGVKAASLPLREDPDTFLEEALGSGAGYAMADYVDSLSKLYLMAAVERRPGAFCPIADFGDQRNPRITRLFGLLPDADPRVGEVERTGDTFSVRMARCPEGSVLSTPRPGLPQSVDKVPLLALLDS